MKYKFLKNFYFALLIVGLSVSLMSFRIPAGDPEQLFKWVVVNKLVLDSIFNDGANEIVFQHSSQKGDRRQKSTYQLIAFVKKGERYTGVPVNFFENRTTEMFETIKLKEGATSKFGNLVLRKNSIPVVEDASYKYIIFYPEAYNPNTEDPSAAPDYIHYQMYLAQNPDDNVADSPNVKTRKKGKMIPAAGKQAAVSTLNPSPPGR